MKRKTGALISILLVSFVTLGCQEPVPEQTPQEIINGFLEQYHQLNETEKEGERDFTGSVNYESGEDKLNAEGTLMTKFNVKDTKEILAELVLGLKGKGKITTQAGEVDLNATLQIANQNTAYLTLNKADIVTDDPQVNQVIALIANMYLNHPFSFPLPEGMKETLEKGTQLTISNESIPKEMMVTIVRENTFLKLLSVIDERKHIYTVTIDIPTLKNYLKAVADSGGKTISDEDLASYDEMEKGLKYDLELDIGTAPEYRLENIKGSVEFLAQNPSTSTGTIRFDIRMKEKSSEGTITAELIDKDSTPLNVGVTYSSTSTDSAYFTWNPKKLEEESEPFDLLGLLGGAIAPEDDEADTLSEDDQSPSE